MSGKMLTSQPFIELRDLKKAYHTPAGDYPAIRGLDLHIFSGEFVAIVGKSGAGKSTLVNLITGIDRPDEGQIHVAGVAVHALNENQRARWRGRNLGVVFQFFQLLPNLSLAENVAIPMDFCDTYPVLQHRSRALELLAQVGIREHADKIPSKISGGQQQRVAIARALANDPPLIIADEPTGNLDAHTASQILDLFAELVRLGHTLVIVTHDREIAARATRQIQLVDGQVIDEIASVA